MRVDVTGRIRSLVGVANDDHDFECVACGHGFDANRQACPECGGFDIRRS